MILMQAPGPDMTFAGMPSGSTYVSNQYAMIMITNDSVDDQTALAAAGCFTLSPFGGWGTFSFATLADLYAADTGAILPGITGFPQHTTCQVMADTTLANNGTWYKTGTGNGAGNWSFTNALLTSGAAAAAAAALQANLAAAAAATSAASAGAAAGTALAQANIASTQSALAQAAANLASTSAQQVQAALLGLPVYPLINASTAAGGSNVLPKGITSGTVGGTAVSGATVGTYPLTATGGDFTGVQANLVVSSATAATIVIINPGRTGVASPTAPTWSNPSGANLPSGTTLTANIGDLISGGGTQYYVTSDSSGTSLLYWQNIGTSVPVAVLDGAGKQLQIYLKSGVDAKANAASSQIYTLTLSIQNAFKGILNYNGTSPIIPFVGAIGPSGYRNAHGFRTSDGAMVHYAPIAGPGVDTGVANSSTGKQIATIIRTLTAPNNGRTVLLAVNYSEMLSYDAGDVYLGGVPALRKAAAYDYLPSSTKPIMAGSLGFDAMASDGQSLSVGAGTNQEVLTTAPPTGFTNLSTFSGGVKSVSGADVASFGPLHEDNKTEANATTSANYGESICSAAGIQMARMALVENGLDPSHLNIFVFNGGQSSQPLSALSKGTTYYNRFISQVTSAATVAAQMGKVFRLHLIHWKQGETDIDNNTPYATYLSGFMQIATDLNTDCVAAINTVMAAYSLPLQTSPVHILTYQTDYRSRTTAGANIVLAQAEAVRQHPLIHFTGPIWYAPNADAYHKTGVGYHWMGLYDGRAGKQLIVDGRVPDALWAQAAYVQAAVPQTVRIRFRVPKPPLQIDTVSIGKATDNGVLIKDDTGTLTLSNFRVENGDTLLIDINRTLGTNPVVRCGLDYIGTGITGGTTRASHNLRDSTTLTRQIVSAVSGTITVPLYHLANHFQLNILTLGA